MSLMRRYIRFFNERDPRMKAMIKLTIEGAKRNNIYVGICGQAPSDYPDMVEDLVSMGIDSISLTPDTIMETRLVVRAAESKQNETILNIYHGSNC
ncbi:Phosphoenolpyruvate synthase [hydrothermal vent metagenome]|uniref:Phosphoenolpyruvate synthase n=1 Tax=hydrothermal vent metagenome TaxID=652676 RepID=A0A3B0Z6S8_9ZZZZ